MVPTLTSLLFGAKRTVYHRSLALLLGFGVFAVTFAGYALGIFTVSGGLVWIPYYAAVVGMVAACGIGYYRAGVVIAWTITYTSLLGYHADHAFLGLPRRSSGEQFAYFVRLDSLVFLAVEGIILGTIAFSLGFLVRWGIESLWHGTPASSDTTE